MNKNSYIINYRKKTMEEKKKAQFNTDLGYEEKQELDKLLKENGLSKVDFIRISKKLLKKGCKDFKKKEGN